MVDFPFKWQPQNEIEQWRYDTFWQKEPETVAWINSFQDGDFFWDIGANLGVYTLYFASLYQKGIVCAFEPSMINIQRLADIADLNGFKNIIPIHMVLSNENKFVKWIDKDTRAGATGGEFVDASFFDKDHCPMTTIDNLEKQGMVVPQHIKIDVDGGEFAIIEGGLYTFGNKNLKSVLVELDPACTNIPLVCELMRQKGFTMNNEFNNMDNHSRYRRMRENIMVENVVFTR